MGMIGLRAVGHGPWSHVHVPGWGTCSSWWLRLACLPDVVISSVCAAADCDAFLPPHLLLAAGDVQHPHRRVREAVPVGGGGARAGDAGEAGGCWRLWAGGWGTSDRWRQGRGSGSSLQGMVVYGVAHGHWGTNTRTGVEQPGIIRGRRKAA